VKKIYQKLVRDRIPDIIANDGKTFATRKADEEEIVSYAFKKLHEEIQEFTEDPSAAEAADVMEIFHFLCSRLELRDSEIMAQATSKRILRGGFEEGTILEWVDEE
jgi:predicted house-cleaning noncanonical NTP pyrophosphatase (MazG superfamily)